MPGLPLLLALAAMPLASCATIMNSNARVHGDVAVGLVPIEPEAEPAPDAAAAGPVADSAPSTP